MLRTDTGNFNRFLTSLGLVLLAAALVIPYFYFRNTEILSIPDAELREMTETGRTALSDRQDAITSLEPWVVGGAILLALGGGVLLVAGGLRLKSAQESEDEETELRKDRARLELSEMSPAERAAQVAEKASDEIEQERSEAPVVKAGRPPGSWARSEKTIARISERVNVAFQRKDLSGHTFQSQVRIGTASHAIRLDGVFESTHDGDPDVLLETRVASTPRIILKVARSVANDLIAKLTRYQAMTTRPARVWLVYVLRVEPSPDDDPQSLSHAKEILRDAVSPFGDATVITEAEIDQLPELFAETFTVSTPPLRW